MPDLPSSTPSHLLSVEFTLKENQAFPFKNAIRLLVGMAEAAGWKLISASSSVTGAAFPGTILHLWEVPRADARLDRSDPTLGDAYAQVLELCEPPKQEILAPMPYSPTSRVVYDGPLRIHYFLWVEILVLPGKFEQFSAVAGKLVTGIMNATGDPSDPENKNRWTLVRAGSPPGDPTRVMHLWELGDANALLNGMRAFTDTASYSDLIDCCSRHTQEIYTSMPYDPLGPNPVEFHTNPIE